MGLQATGPDQGRSQSSGVFEWDGSRTPPGAQLAIRPKSYWLRYNLVEYRPGDTAA
jgi:hypothetical protein